MIDKNVKNRKVLNPLSEKLLRRGKRDDYGYDSLYRHTEYRKDGDLNGNSPAKTIGYTLDGVGNRTQVTENGTSTAYAVNNLNQYTSVGGVVQTHDDNGKLTSDGTRTFSYDYANRLVRIVTVTQTITYKYDVFGRRIEKSVDGSITRYFYEGNRVIEDRDGADAVSATYVFGNGIDEVLTMDRGGQTYYHHTNAQGSITEITDAAGAIVERYEYDAYGAITIFTAPGADGIWQTADDIVSATSAIGNRYTFTGREYESESGLYYYRARFYDPATGRFLQRDPIGNDALGNLYAYVNNSPAVYVDSWGLDGEWVNVNRAVKTEDLGEGFVFRYMIIEGEYYTTDILSKYDDYPELLAQRGESKAGKTFWNWTHKRKLTNRELVALTGGAKIDADSEFGQILGNAINFLSPLDMQVIRRMILQGKSDEEIATYVAKQVGLNLLTKGIGKFAKGTIAITAIIHKHHLWPKYLQGLRDQTLKKLPKSLHDKFHSLLDKWKGGKYPKFKGAEAFKDMDPKEIASDLREFCEKADGGTFKKYLPDLERSIEETLKE